MPTNPEGAARQRKWTVIALLIANEIRGICIAGPALWAMFHH